MQSFAMAHAMLCEDGCNALRLKMAKLAQKQYVLFRIKEKGGKIHNMGHCCPKGNYSPTNKASMLGATYTRNCRCALCFSIDIAL